MKRLTVLVVVSGSLLIQAQTKPSANIRGTVTDQTGAPVAGATVYTVAQGLAFEDATPPSVKTDSKGLFDFRGRLDLGTYKLYSQKVADGYLSPFDSFYADKDAKAPNIDLTRNHPSATATVKLGPQAAVIAGRILDAKTGASLKASLGFEDSEGHGHEIEVDGTYRILVPPDKKVILMVLLPPPVDRSFIPVAPLKLEPGQYVNLDLPISAE